MNSEVRLKLAPGDCKLGQCFPAPRESKGVPVWIWLPLDPKAFDDGLHAIDSRWEFVHRWMSSDSSTDPLPVLVRIR